MSQIMCKTCKHFNQTESKNYGICQKSGVAQMEQGYCMMYEERK